MLLWLTIERWCAARAAAMADSLARLAGLVSAPPLAPGACTGCRTCASFARTAALTRRAAATRLAMLAKPPLPDDTLTATGDAAAGAADVAVSAVDAGTTAVLAAEEPASIGCSSVGRRSPSRVRPPLSLSEAQYDERRHAREQRAQPPAAWAHGTPKHGGSVVVVARRGCPPHLAAWSPGVDRACRSTKRRVGVAADMRSMLAAVAMLRSDPARDRTPPSTVATSSRA